MKRILLCASLVVSPCVHAIDQWRGEDTARELVYMTSHIIDWRQSLYIADHPWLHAEGNAILGPHPSDSEVNRYFAATALLHMGVSYVLPHKWRTAWQYITIGVEVGVNYHNYRAGVKIVW